MIKKRLEDAAYATPDPERSLKNLFSFLENNPSKTDELTFNLREISLLFSISQFLANYCSVCPEVLFETLKDLDSPIDKSHISLVLKDSFNRLGDLPSPSAPLSRSINLDRHMKSVREFKIRKILKITLRDILGKADLVEIMAELSLLADTIIENSLLIIRKSMENVYGLPANDSFSVISLGKLGGEELNFSSDVDLIFVYGSEDGETAGVKTNQGITTNRTSNHEFYCKLGELFTRFLSLNTDAGFAYRVDLRLRPEGQRGNIALSLRSYETYYESWGRAWERAMLLRARPVAGEPELGSSFMDAITPFVYRKYLDFSSIEEIKNLKKRIDSTFKKDDIKRGFGGIREVEFFAQAFQLIYGGKEPMLRERSILKVLHRILQKGLIGTQDYSILSNNYRFYRTLEHRLQQLNDIQTHTLPSAVSEQESTARKMGFNDRSSFLSDLAQKRENVRMIYDSLFVEAREEPSIHGTLFGEEFSDAELRTYLSKTKIRDIEKAVHNIQSIKDSTFTFQTLRGRKLLGEILPAFVDFVLKGKSPDAALNHLQSFANLLSTRESYLEIFSRHKELMAMLTYVFAQSGYLSKMLINRPQYLEMIGWQEILKKSLSSLIDEIRTGISSGHSLNDAVRIIRQMEEIRLGLLLLQKKIGVTDVIKGLSKTAEAVLSVCIEHLPKDNEDMAVIGLGKLGGREISFNSDLDLIFVCPEHLKQPCTKSAERFLRMLISYTKEGIAYKVDTRLRPEGSKGPLVSSVESYKKYYAGAAAFWEFQALLKARPVAGNTVTGQSFMDMAQNTLIERGGDIPASEIRRMRERIMRELSKESEGYDIKLGPGGIEEIEFAVQYLQLTNCRKDRRVLVQGTLDGLRRLGNAGVLNNASANLLEKAYVFYRTLECFLRLKGENILRDKEDLLENTAEFMGLEDRDVLTEHLGTMRKNVKEITAGIIADS